MIILPAIYNIQCHDSGILTTEMCYGIGFGRSAKRKINKYHSQ